MGFFHKITKAVSHAVKHVAHDITHPQDIIKTAVKGVSNIGHGLDDIIHGDFKHGLGEVASGIKNVADPAHVVGEIHQLSRPFTDPINKGLAKGIKGITGHNVLGHHPLNAIGTVVASVATAGAAGAAIQGASFAASLAAGVGSLEAAGASIAGGIGSGLTAIGADSLGATVSGWGTALQSAAAANAFTGAGVAGAQAAGANAGSSITSNTWQAGNASSVFNGGVGAQALGAQNAGIQTGSSIGNAMGLSVPTGDTAGFGFGNYSYATAGSAGASAGQMGIQGVQTTALGSNVVGNAGGYTGLGQAATGQLGTGGVGLYGETAEGVIAHSTGPTSLFNYGVNTAVPYTSTNMDTAASKFKKPDFKNAIQQAMTPAAQGGSMGMLEEAKAGKSKRVGFDQFSLGKGATFSNILSNLNFGSPQVNLQQAPLTTSELLGGNQQSSGNITAF